MVFYKTHCVKRDNDLYQEIILPCIFIINDLYNFEVHARFDVPPQKLVQL